MATKDGESYGKSRADRRAATETTQQVLGPVVSRTAGSPILAYPEAHTTPSHTMHLGCHGIESQLEDNRPESLVVARNLNKASAKDFTVTARNRRRTKKRNEVPRFRCPRTLLPSVCFEPEECGSSPKRDFDSREQRFAYRKAPSASGIRFPDFADGRLSPTAIHSRLVASSVPVGVVGVQDPGQFFKSGFLALALRKSKHFFFASEFVALVSR